MNEYHDWQGTAGFRGKRRDGDVQIETLRVGHGNFGCGADGALDQGGLLECAEVWCWGAWSGVVSMQPCRMESKRVNYPYRVASTILLPYEVMSSGAASQFFTSAYLIPRYLLNPSSSTPTKDPKVDSRIVSLIPAFGDIAETTTVLSTLPSRTPSYLYAPSSSTHRLFTFLLSLIHLA